MSLRWLYENVELPLVCVLGDMELAGVRLDVPYFEALAATMEAASVEDYAKVVALVGYEINTRSYPQKIRLFYDELEETVKRRTKNGNSSVDKYAMGQFERQDMVRAIQNHMETVDALSDFVYKLPRLLHPDGRLHGSFNQAGTWEEAGGDHKASPATGRLSSSSPDMQQIATRGRWGPSIRRGFVPEPGYLFVGGDVGQEELRIAALLAGEERLLEIFRDPSRYVHMETVEFLGLPQTGSGRQVAKNCNYGLIYKVAAPKLHAMLLEEDPELPYTVGDVSDMRKRWLARYPAFATWWGSVITGCRVSLYVETWFGRRRYLPDIVRPNRTLKAAAERESINTVVQGTGADVVKLVLRRVWDALQGHDARIILSSHDDIVVEAAVSEVAYVVDVIQHMTDGLLPVTLPVEAKVGPNWADMKEVS